MKKFSIDYVGGQIHFELDREHRANNHCKVLFGNGCVVFVTMTIKRLHSPSLDVKPLNIRYLERFYASGKVPKSKIKRETFQTEGEILTGRLIDRSLRSNMPKFMNEEVSITCLVTSLSDNQSTVIPSIIASSILLKRFYGDDFNIVIPYQVKISDDSNLFILVNKKGLALVDYSSSTEPISISEIESSLKKVEINKEHIFNQIENEIISNPLIFDISEVSQYKKVNYESNKNLSLLVKYYIDRNDPFNSIEILKQKVSDIFGSNYLRLLKIEIENYIKELIPNRMDFRDVDTIRKLDFENNPMIFTHSSAIFSRGKTTSLTSLTIGSSREDNIIIDGIRDNISNVYGHYNFHDFSVGEVHKKMFITRREIGHGKILDTSVKYMIKNQSNDNLSYRLVSEILSSDGSSSMASVCSAFLSIKPFIPNSNILGAISVGLIGETLVLDITGLEDEYSSMDLKVVSNDKSKIINIHMDIKVTHISNELFLKGIKKAIDANNDVIIPFLLSTVSEDNNNKKNKQFPVSKIIKINPKQMGYIIGYSGNNIKDIAKNFNVKINIKNNSIINIIGIEEDVFKAVERIGFLLKNPT